MRLCILFQAFISSSPPFRCFTIFIGILKRFLQWKNLNAVKCDRFQFLFSIRFFIYIKQQTTTNNIQQRNKTRERDEFQFSVISAVCTIPYLNAMWRFQHSCGKYSVDQLVLDEFSETSFPANPFEFTQSRPCISRTSEKQLESKLTKLNYVFSGRRRSAVTTTIFRNKDEFSLFWASAKKM